MKQNPYIFVYGTLQRGFHNHRLLATALFSGPAQTADKYVLRSRPGGIPFVGKDEARYPIHGELYVVKEHELAQLDRLEGCRMDAPELSWYHRERIAVLVGSQRVTAWIYFNPDRSEPVAPHGNWSQLDFTETV